MVCSILFLYSPISLFLVTAEMVNDLKDSHNRIPLLPIDSSHQLSTIFQNALDESSDNSNDPTNTPNKASDNSSQPPFPVKNLKTLPKMTAFNLFFLHISLFFPKLSSFLN